jgi:hypothetical protein
MSEVEDSSFVDVDDAASIVVEGTIVVDESVVI